MKFKKHSIKIFPTRINAVESIYTFIEYISSTKSLSKNTIHAYQNDLIRVNEELSIKNLFTASSDDIIKLIHDMEYLSILKKSTIKRRVSTLKQYLTWAKENGIIQNNPIEHIKLTIKLPKNLPKNLSKKEITTILFHTQQIAIKDSSYINTTLLFIFNFLFVTGIRIGELVNIKIQDICIEESFVLIHGKGDKQRKVYLPGNRIKSILKEFLIERNKINAHSYYLFIFEDGKRISPQYIRRRLKLLSKTACIQKNITPHMFRHTAATQLIESGVDIRFVQKLLGHASIVTTQIYTQVSDISLQLTLEKADLLTKLGSAMKDN